MEIWTHKRNQDFGNSKEKTQVEERKKAFSIIVPIAKTKYL